MNSRLLLIAAAIVSAFAFAAIAMPRSVDQGPRFILVSFSSETARIVKQGDLSKDTYSRLFLKGYALLGERIHPPKNAVVAGLLIAYNDNRITTVPIQTWKLPDGRNIFLCQASENGQPPAFFAVSYSENGLLAEVEKALKEPAGQTTSPPLSTAEKAEIEQWQGETWQIGVDLDMPRLEPPAVQYAVFDEDPVPAFTALVKRMSGHYRQQLKKADNEARREQFARSG